MVLLWDEAVNRLAREQTDLLEEMGLQAPEDTIQVGCCMCYFVLECVLACVTAVGRGSQQAGTRADRFA
jgi:hypothetical protein